MIRCAQTIKEVQEAFHIEEMSYPSVVAATLPAFMERFRLFGAYFITAFEEGEVIGVANGVRMNHDDLSDEGMKQMSDYSVDGSYFCLLTVAVRSDHRRRGIAGRLLRAIIRQASEDGLKAVLLMCEKHLIPYYEKSGFIYVRPSGSVHGGIQWYEMRLNL